MNPLYGNLEPKMLWEIPGYVSCVNPTFFVSIAAIIDYLFNEVLTKGPNSAKLYGRDIEGFLFKGIKDIDCEISCCVPAQCDYKHDKSVPAILNWTNSPMDGVYYKTPEAEFLFIHRHFRLSTRTKFTDPLERYIFEHKQEFKITKRSFYQSWESASLSCEKLGGHLPVFRNRKSIEQFINLLKTKGIPFIEAIFIGLKMDSKSKVSLNLQNLAMCLLENRR